MTGPSQHLGNTPGDAPRARGMGEPGLVEGDVDAVNEPPVALEEALVELAMDERPLGGPKRRVAPPTWCSPREACALIVRGYTLRTGIAVASVVGTLLSAVNEGSVIAAGHLEASTWIRVATNYLVPFVVASIGYLAPFRRRRGTNR